MNLRNALKIALRKIVGWALIVFSAFSFPASFILLARGDLGTFATGFLFSLFVFVLGWRIQTNLEKPRKRIIALFGKYFPRCPICKSDKGYEARGFLPSSQYVKCKNCEAEWTSVDFVGLRNLESLKLWNPPEVPQVYAEFIAQSPLKLRKAYPTKSWQALMNGEEIQLPQKTGIIDRIQLEDLLSSHKKGVFLCLISSALILSAPFVFILDYEIGCFIISLVTSLVLTIIGFYGFTVSKENAYILFCTLFIGAFIGLMAIPRL